MVSIHAKCCYRFAPSACDLQSSPVVVVNTCKATGTHTIARCCLQFCGRMFLDQGTVDSAILECSHRILSPQFCNICISWSSSVRDKWTINKHLPNGINTNTIRINGVLPLFSHVWSMLLVMVITRHCISKASAFTTPTKRLLCAYMSLRCGEV